MWTEVLVLDTLRYQCTKRGVRIMIENVLYNNSSCRHYD